MIKTALPTMEFLSNIKNFDMESKYIINTLKTLKGLDVEFFKIQVRAKRPNFTVERLENEHKVLCSLFKKAIEGIGIIKSQMNEKMNSVNFDNELLLETISTEDFLESSLRETNDLLLTYRPTAKIEYGNQCIGDVITTSNEKKIQEILTKHKGLRKVRGDGNCFLSSLITRLLENYAQHNKLSALVELVKNDKLEQSPLAKTAFYEEMLPLLKKEITEIFESIQNDPSKIKEILADNKKILPLIKYFRILAADEMITKKKSV